MARVSWVGEARPVKNHKKMRFEGECIVLMFATTLAKKLGLPPEGGEVQITEEDGKLVIERWSQV